MVDEMSSDVHENMLFWDMAQTLVLHNIRTIRTTNRTEKHQKTTFPHRCSSSHSALHRHAWRSLRARACYWKITMCEVRVGLVQTCVCVCLCVLCVYLLPHAQYWNCKRAALPRALEFDEYILYNCIKKTNQQRACVNTMHTFRTYERIKDGSYAML